MSEKDEVMAVFIVYVRMLEWHGSARGTAWYQNMLCRMREFLSKEWGLSNQQVQETTEWLSLKID